MHVQPDVLIIGAGVSGLSTAIRLAEDDLVVEVMARHLPRETTSCAAAAMWAPYLVTDVRLNRWSAQTRTELITWGPDDGVWQVRGREVARDQKAAPDWMLGLPHHRVCTADEVPSGFTTGWWYEAPVVDMPRYLDVLVGRLRRRNVRIREGTVHTIEDALRRAPVVVNCTGADARDLVGDDDLTPVRGQLVVVANPGIKEFFVEHEETPPARGPAPGGNGDGPHDEAPTYFLPHGEDRLVLGGSVEPGRADRTPRAATAVAIQERCAKIDERIRNAPVIEHRVGIRPQRPRVRLERVAVGRGHVIHNYGHGGAGVTLSWGCAQEVRGLVHEVV